MRHLSSLYLTLAALLVFAGMLVWSRVSDVPVGAEIAFPLGVLVLNLLAAVASNPKLYSQIGLLVFHLGLAALAATCGVGQLIAFKGRIEVPEGAPFSTSDFMGDRPILMDLPELGAEVVQGSFTIAYDPGMSRRETSSQVFVAEKGGAWREFRVGDDKPLLLSGYRFYTTGNKGFAPILTWTDSLGRSATGALNLPSYPMNDERQGNEFSPPGLGRAIFIWLDIAKPIYDDKGTWTFRLPDQSHLAVVDGERRVVLEPGQDMELDGGRLRYERLSTWMGYTVFYDPTIPWLIAAAMVAILGLGWHVVGRLRAVAADGTWTKVDDVG